MYPLSVHSESEASSQSLVGHGGAACNHRACSQYDEQRRKFTKEHDSFPAACWVSLSRLTLRLPILRRHAHRCGPYNDVLSSSELNSDGSDPIRS